MKKPKVEIVMGSDSDMEIMKGAVDILKDFEIDYNVSVISAHRTPAKAVEFAENCEESADIIIAGAGKAAHLPGVLAAITTTPVIGVPIKTSMMGGMDSLLSIVQMPTGIPVATVGVNGAANAALLAAQFLGLKHEAIREKVRKYRERMKSDVDKKDKKVKEALL